MIRVTCDRCGWRPPRRGWPEARPLAPCPLEGCAGVLLLPLDLRFLSAFERAIAGEALERLLEKLDPVLEVQGKRARSVRIQAERANTAAPIVEDEHSRSTFLYLAGLRDGLELHRRELEALAELLEIEALDAKRGRRRR